MANLMQLGNEFEDILELIKINEGEITQEVEEKLSRAEVAIIEKVDNVGFYVRRQEKEIEVLKEFELSAKNHRSVKEADLKGFKVWLARAVRAFGSAEGYSSKVLAGQVVKIKDISKDVLTLNENLIEDKYRKVVVTLEMSVPEYEKIYSGKGMIRKFLDCSNSKSVEMLDDKKIKAAIEAGEKVQGVGTELKLNTQLLGLKKLEASNG